MTGNVRAWRGILPAVGERVYIDPAAVVIGRVRIGDDSSIWPGTVVRGDVNAIVIGARTSVQDGSVLHVTHDGPYSPGGFALDIGDEVTIGHRAVLHGCRIGNRCLIGMGTIVMDGAVTENEVLVAAGAVVTPGTTCTARSLYAGSPARRARALRPEEIEALAYAARRYVALKDDYLAAGAAPD